MTMGDSRYVTAAAAAMPLASPDDDALDPSAPLPGAENRDSDGTPVGSADAAADAERSSDSNADSDAV